MNTTLDNSGRRNAMRPADIRTLTMFEMSRYRIFASPYRATDGRRKWVSRSTALALGFIAACTLVAARYLAQPNDVFALGLVIWGVGCILVGTTNGIGVSRSVFKDWWLGFPYPRQTLITSKWLAAVLNSVRWFGILFIWSVLAYFVGWALHPVRWMPNELSFVYIALIVATMAVVVPMLNAMTLALISASLVLQAIVMATLFTSFLLLQVLWSIAQSGDITLWVYTLCAGLIFGWPLSAILLWTTTRRISSSSRPLQITVSPQPRSWRRDKSASPTSTFEATPVAQNWATHKPTFAVPAAAWLKWPESVTNRPVSQFWAVLTLQASRFRWFGTGADVRLTIMALLLPSLGVVAGVIIHQQGHLIAMPATICLFGAGMTMWMGASGATVHVLRTSAGWTLGYPLPRTFILMASFAAWWLRWGVLIVCTEAGIWLGMLIRALIHPLPPSDYHLAAAAFGRAGLFSIVLFPLLQLILQVSSYAFRRWNAWLQLAVIGSIWFLSTRGVHNSAVFSNRHSWLLGPQYWTVIVLTIVIGIPLAVWFVRTASRNLHIVFIDPLSRRM